MSGFELAGLILGAVPLLISALEHYGDGLSTLKRWRRYEHELRSLVRNLDTERVKLQNVCEKLLVGIVPESQIETMIKDPRGNLWREEKIQKKIQSRLWEGYRLFEDTVADIKKAVEEMEERIKNQSRKKASTLKRTIFTLSRNQYADLILIIREGVANLENLTDRNIELEPARKVRSQGKLFKVLRTMSKGLYRALKSSIDCPCSHDISLKLEKRSNTAPMDDSEEVMSNLTFKIALSRLSAGVTERLEEKEWKEIMIKPKLSPTDNKHLLESASLPIQSKGKSKKSVSFASSSNTSTITMTRTQSISQNVDIQTSIQTLPIGVASIGLYNLDAITNLCEKLKRAQKQAQVSTYGMVIDRSPEGTRKFTLHPIPTSNTEDTRCWSVIALKQILEQKDTSIYLTYQDRLHLAVIISSSILQLHGSPWLSGTISSQDIFFIQKKYFPFYDQPFVMKSLPTKSVATQNVCQDAPFPRNPVLVSLGVLLVELIQGKPINLLRTPQEESLTHTKLLQDYMTVKRLLQDVRMASSNYAAAVTRCVDGDFHNGGLTLDNEELCEGVYSGIVALLERDLEYT
ncbi:hypothetical protein RRF57_002313 [Xylaria bambusicola]|uniref:DUF7580 domain-containing protein n=1 Tax=Xylaria bambusicola TaxID=326684 RepID=A0AAN7UED3_9PEZI